MNLDAIVAQTREINRNSVSYQENMLSKELLKGGGMHTYAIWQNHRVIGYIGLTTNQREQLNGLDGIGVYFGYDSVTRANKNKMEVKA